MKRQLLGLMLVCGSLLYGCSSGQEIAEPIENSQDNVEDVVVEKEYRELTPEELEAFLNPLVESCRVSQYVAYDKKFVKDQLEWYKDTTGNDFLETDDYQVTLRNKVEAADEASELFEYDFGRIAEAANATLSKPETTEQKTQDNNTQESKVIFYCTDETGYTWEPKVCARIYIENNLKDPTSFKANTTQWTEAKAKDGSTTLYGTYSAKNGFGARVENGFIALFDKKGEMISFTVMD